MKNPDHLRHLGRPLRPPGQCPDCDRQRAQLMQPSAVRCSECDATEGHYIDCSRLGE